ncbi:glycosyltransferase [Aerococcaceae bacterium NML180378]|nr:glycosyltransferase [Aerococcaceae bacterium NML180378]
MKHIVFILGSYYPNYSAVGKCMGNIATVMAQTNKVTVIGTQTQLDQLSTEEYNEQNIIRVITPHERRRFQLERLVATSVGIKRCFARTLQWFFRLLGVLKIFVTPATLDYQLVTEYGKALDQLAIPADVIVPTCIPFESVMSALKYKEKHPDVVLLPCLYDLFAANWNLNRTPWNYRLKWANNLKLERAMFEQAHHVFHVGNWTKHIEEHHAEYRTKHTEIEHPLLVYPTNQLSCQASSEIHMVYTGVVDEKNRNPQKVLQILAQIKHKGIVSDFYSFGSGQSIVEQFATQYSTIIAHGKVESQVAEFARAQASILISIGNKDVNQVPSKLIEYMATGKPIMHFAWSSEDSAVKLLNHYPAKKIIYLDNLPPKEEIESFIMEHKNVIIPFEEVKQWIPEATPEDVFYKLKKHSGGGYILVFAGALRKNYVEPDYILELFGVEPLCQLCNISFYSAGTGIDTVQNTTLSNVHLKGWLPKLELDNVYENADVFVSIAEKTGKQISSKIFDYMSYGKPIIHVYFSPEDVNLKYLRKYPNALCLLADESRLREQRAIIQLFLQGRVGQQIYGDDLDEMLHLCTPICVSEIIMNKVYTERKS